MTIQTLKQLSVCHECYWFFVCLFVFWWGGGANVSKQCRGKCCAVIITSSCTVVSKFDFFQGSEKRPSAGACVWNWRWVRRKGWCECRLCFVLFCRFLCCVSLGYASSLSLSVFLCHFFSCFQSRSLSLGLSLSLSLLSLSLCHTHTHLIFVLLFVCLFVREWWLSFVADLAGQVGHV